MNIPGIKIVITKSRGNHYWVRARSEANPDVIDGDAYDSKWEAKKAAKMHAERVLQKLAQSQVK